MNLSFILSMTLLAATPHGGTAESVPSPASLNRIKELLREVPLIDGHNDLPWQYRKRGNDMSLFDLTKNTSSSKLATDIPRLKAGCVGGQFWSVYIDPAMDGSVAVRAVLEQIDVVHRMVAEYPEALELALTADDIERIHRAGRVASLIGMEGGHSIDNSLAMLRMMYALGARYMTLTHTKTLDWADAAGDKPKSHGLSEFGERVILEMNYLGMMVDVSHLSDEAVLAAIRISRVPVIASHSGLRHFTPGFERNLSDELARAIAAKGGVVQIPFGIAFINKKASDDLQAYFKATAELRTQNATAAKAGRPTQDKDAFDEAWAKSHPVPATSIDAVIEQIDYAVKLIGDDHVGLGSDFDGVSGNLPNGLRTAADYPNLIAGLRARGYSDESMRKILGGNVLRVWMAVEAARGKG